MSNPALTGDFALSPNELPASRAPTPAPEVQPPPRTLTQQALIDTFNRTGARLGAAWVAVLAFCGVFAPFLANSHPLAMKAEGQWSFPLLHHLTPADVVVLFTFLACVVAVLMRGVRKRVRLIVILGTLILSLVLSLLFVKPPQTVVY